MTEANRQSHLQFALRVLGAVLVLGFYPLTKVWPSGWIWHTGQSNYIEMMIGLYATLGVFVWRAARDPVRHLSLISFTLWSSLVHGTIMAVQAVMHPVHRSHLVGDVPALLLAAAVLGWLSPRALTLPFARTEPVTVT